MKMTIQNAKTARGMAGAVYKAVSKFHKLCGGSPEYVYLWSPDETEQRGYGRCWAVCWEEGPYEWAIMASMGESISEAEYGAEMRAEINHSPKATWEAQIIQNPSVLAEPYNSHILCFYNN
jgi:hypothetical protein